MRHKFTFIIDDKNYGVHFLITLIISFLSFSLFMFLAFIFAFFIWDIDTTQLTVLLNPYNSEINISMLKYFQIMQSIGLFIFSSVVVLRFLYKNEGSNFVLLDKAPNPEKLVIAIPIIFTILPFINLLGQLNTSLNLPDFLYGIQSRMEQMENDAARLTELFLNINSPGDFWINMFMIAFLPAVGEELLFRGIIQRQLSHWFRNYHLGIILSAVLFSAMHMQFFGFLPRMVLGILFGYLMIWSGSLWVPIVAHFLNNSLAVIAFSFLSDGEMLEQLETIGTNNYLIWTSLVSLIISGSFLFLLYKMRSSDVFNLRNGRPA